MSVLYIVIPLALVMSACAVGLFLWAVRGGQFDDLTTPAVRILHDDDGGTKPVPTAAIDRTPLSLAQQSQASLPQDPL